MAGFRGGCGCLAIGARDSQDDDVTPVRRVSTSIEHGGGSQRSLKMPTEVAGGDGKVVCLNE